MYCWPGASDMPSDMLLFLRPASSAHISDDCGDVVAKLHDLSPGWPGSSLLDRWVVRADDYVAET